MCQRDPTDRPNLVLMNCDDLADNCDLGVRVRVYRKLRSAHENSGNCQIFLVLASETDYGNLYGYLRK